MTFQALKLALKTAFRAKRTFPAPYVTADCLLFLGDEKVLLIRRKNNPFKGQWAIPGGFVEPGEETHLAAIRELKEETGVVVQGVRPVGTYGKAGRDPRGWIISCAYAAVVHHAPPIQARDDAAEVAWIPIEEAIAMDLAFDHSQILRDAHSNPDL